MANMLPAARRALLLPRVRHRRHGGARRARRATLGRIARFGARAHQHHKARGGSAARLPSRASARSASTVHIKTKKKKKKKA